MQPKYKRVLLKLSGEALAGNNKFGLDYDTVYEICKGIKKCVDIGAEIAIVVGGGNFWRGRSSGKMDRFADRDRLVQDGGFIETGEILFNKNTDAVGA